MEVYSNIDVGKRVRKKRKDFCYTNYKLAEMLDISPRFLSAIERGEKGMSYTTIKKMCDILCTTSDYLLFGKEESHHNLENSNIIKMLSNIDREYIPMIEKLILNFIETVNIVTNNVVKKGNITDK